MRHSRPIAGTRAAKAGALLASWPGLSWVVPAIHVCLSEAIEAKTWMPGTRLHKAGHDREVMRQLERNLL